MSDLSVDARQTGEGAKLEDAFLESIANELVDACFKWSLRIGRAVVYCLAAYALSFALPISMPSGGICAAVLFLGLTRRTTVLAEVLLAIMVVLAVAQPELLKLVGL
jgi:hypothetical protein